MRTELSRAGAALLMALTVACRPAGEGTSAPAASPSPDGASAGAEASAAPAPIEPRSDDQAGFAAIAPDEAIRFLGTEPFWGGTVRGEELVYSTPENQAGDTVTVRRFAGNNGLGFSGTWNGAPLDMAVTPGWCSDGMSERRYPYTVTLKLGEEQRNGCAWTARKPFRGPANP